MCSQQGRTGGIAPRLYVDSGAVGVSGDRAGPSRTPGDSSSTSSGAAFGAMCARAVAVARAGSVTRKPGRGTTCRGRSIRSRCGTGCGGSGVGPAAFEASGSASRTRTPALTRRFRQRIGLDCQSMPTSHAAVRHDVSWGTARRAERAFLDAWDRTRPKRRPRHLGVDEIHRGKGQRFWTVLSDLVHGEVMGLRRIAAKRVCARC